jgi:hypothetical protein
MAQRHFALLALAIAAACARTPASSTAAPELSAATVVPIQIVNNHVHLLMTSGGRDVSMIYDTGAGLTLLDMSVAQALGVRLGRPVQVGGTGTAPVRAFAIDGGRLVLPQDSSIRVKPVIALEMSLSLYEGVPVNGILGADFTRQAVVQLDYERGTMILHPRDFRYQGTGTRIPLTFKDGHPHASGHVMLADSTRLAADCLVDVGASGAVFFTKPFVERHRLRERVGPTIRRRFGRGVGGSSWATVGRIAGLRLGNIEIPSPVVAMYGDSAGVNSTDAFDCNIGGDVLRRFNVYLDYGRKEMILEPTAALMEPFEADMGGAAYWMDVVFGGIRMIDIMPRGPAEQAGLREEDLIMEIDGRPALEYGVEALRKRLRQPAGEIVFRVRRGQEELIIRLPVRRLI